MNDVYGVFAKAALDNYVQKGKDEIKGFFGKSSNQEEQKDDLESNSTRSSFTQKVSSSVGSVREKLFTNSQQEPSSVVPSFILSKVSDRSDYTKALIAFAAGALFLLLAVFSLPTIIISPQNFTMYFTLCMICLIFALAFLNGPLTYIKKITSDRKNQISSCVLILSIIFSLYFSIISGSYLMSLLLCFIEVSVSLSQSLLIVQCCIVILL